MKLGMVGLGRTGANMRQRLLGGGQRVFGYDPSVSARQNGETKGTTAADSLAELVRQPKPPRVVWLMVPAEIPWMTRSRR